MSLNDFIKARASLVVLSPRVLSGLNATGQSALTSCEALANAFKERATTLLISRLTFSENKCVVKQIFLPSQDILCYWIGMEHNMTNQEFELRLAEITLNAQRERETQTTVFFDKLLEETFRIERENAELKRQIDALQTALDNALS